MMRRVLIPALLAMPLAATLFAQTSPVKTGQSAFEDAVEQKPGNRIHITVADLPKPDQAESLLLWLEVVELVSRGRGRV